MNIIFHTPTMENAIKAFEKGKLDMQALDGTYYVMATGHRLTLVGVKDYERGLLKVGLSICTAPDNFDKGYGVSRATHRANTKPVASIIMKEFELDSNKDCLEQLKKLHLEIAYDIPHYKRFIGKK